MATEKNSGKKNGLTWVDIEAVEEGTKRVRLSTLAKFINDNLSDLGFSAIMEEAEYDTYRMSGRVITGGSSRTGMKLVVTYPDGSEYEHNPLETYRHNGEVARRMLAWKIGAVA